MPRCDGLPDGACPRNVNNGSVKLSKGDLMLCPACDAIRFPIVVKSGAPIPPSKPDATKTAVVKKTTTAATSVGTSANQRDDCPDDNNDDICPRSTSAQKADVVTMSKEELTAMRQLC